MVREILFRGKRTDNGEWIEGTLYRIANNLNPFVMLKNRCSESHEVDDHTVGQYTGCLDRNGRRIFEGDYLCASDDEDSNLLPVKFVLGSFCIEIDGEYWPMPIYMYEGKCILGICGNIHDGPTCKDK